MEVFTDYLAQIENPQQRDRMEEVLAWIVKKFPNLVPAIKWNQPMYTDHGTYIIGFSTAKAHMSISPERAGMIQFADEIVEAGYSYTKELFRIKWNQPVDFALLEKMIEFNVLDKADCSTFWR